MDNAAAKQGSPSSSDPIFSSSSSSMLLPEVLLPLDSTSSSRLDYQTTCSSGSTSGISSPKKRQQQQAAAAIELPPTPYGMTPKAHLLAAPPSTVDETTSRKINSAFESESPQQQHHHNNFQPHRENHLSHQWPTVDDYRFQRVTTVPQQQLFSPRKQAATNSLFARSSFPAFPQQQQQQQHSTAKDSESAAAAAAALPHLPGMMMTTSSLTPRAASVVPPPIATNNNSSAANACFPRQAQIPPSVLQQLPQQSSLPGESSFLENSENSVPELFNTATLLSELLLGCRQLGDNSLAASYCYDFPTHAKSLPLENVGRPAPASFYDTGDSSTYLAYQLQGLTIDNNGDDNTESALSAATVGSSTPMLLHSAALDGCFTGATTATPWGCEGAPKINVFGGANFGQADLAKQSDDDYCTPPAAAALDFSGSPNRFLSFLLQAAAAAASEQVAASQQQQPFAATAPPILMQQQQQQQENNEPPTPQQQAQQWPHWPLASKGGFSGAAAAAASSSTPVAKGAAFQAVTPSTRATVEAAAAAAAAVLSDGAAQDCCRHQAPAPGGGRGNAYGGATRVVSPGSKSPPLCSSSNHQHHDNPRLKIRLKRLVPGGSGAVAAASGAPPAAAAAASEGPTFWGMWEDERDRMVYVSWLPRSGRASDRQTKKRCELILKDFIRNMLGFAGLEKVLLFPPRSAHCKLLFEDSACAERFLAVFGGTTLGPALWKIFVCKRFGVDIKDGIQSTRVKIIWADQTKNSDAASAAGDLEGKSGFPTHGEVLAGLSSLTADATDSTVATIAAHLVMLLQRSNAAAEK